MNDKPIEQAKTQQEFYDELRNGVIEEVAQHIEKLTGFVSPNNVVLCAAINNPRHRLLLWLCQGFFDGCDSFQGSWMCFVLMVGV